MGEPVARAAKTEPEVVQALREEPGVDSVLPLDAPADGAVSLVQFLAGNLDCTNVRLGVLKLGLRRALPAPLSQHGKSAAAHTIFEQTPSLLHFSSSGKGARQTLFYISYIQNKAKRATVGEDYRG